MELSARGWLLRSCHGTFLSSDSKGRLRQSRSVLDAAKLYVWRFPDGTGEMLPSSSKPLRALLEGATSALVDLSDRKAPPPLPSNAESAALCVCGDGILAMTSEQIAAFTPKEQRYLELCCALIEGPSGL